MTNGTSLYYAIVVALGGFIFGFDASVISGVVGFVTTEFSLNEWQQGFVVSSPTLGAVLGSLFAGPCADAFGRKKLLISIASLYFVSALFSAFAPSYEVLVGARFIGGIAFASLILAPMYIAEISPSNLRGKMISINQFNIVIGFSAAYFANFYLLELSQSATQFAMEFDLQANVWRWMLGLEILPAFAYVLLLFTIPESPRWLALNNKEQQAQGVFKKLFPTQEPEKSITEIKSGAEGSLPPLSTRLAELFSPKMRFILMVGLIVSVSQQITGVNAVYFYAPSIFEQSGVGQNAAFSQAIWVGVINVVFTIVAMALIDKLGRKPLMLIGLFGIVISMSLSAIGFYSAKYQLTEESLEIIESVEVRERLKPIIGNTYSSDVEFKNTLKTLLGEQQLRESQTEIIAASADMNSVLILVGILGFVASFAVSLGPVMWVLLAEIFPTHLRGIGIAFTGLINSAVSFTIQLVFPWEIATFGTATTFIIYGAFALIGFVLVYRLLPETKGKSLEEIKQVFEQAKAAR